MEMGNSARDRDFAVDLFSSGRVENGDRREPERSVPEYVSTASAADCCLQTRIARKENGGSNKD